MIIQNCLKSHTIGAKLKPCSKNTKNETMTLQQKTMTLHFNVHAHAEKEEDMQEMHEDKNIDPMPPPICISGL